MNFMKHSAVAIGTFDGFHLGHRHLVGKLIGIAKKRNLKPILVVLSKPIKPVAGILTTEQEKVALISQYPVDEIIVVSASKELVSQSAASFFEEFLCAKLKMKHLVVGRDFAFGRGRQGDTKWLKKESAVSGTGITVVEPLRRGGKVISSSLIRAYLKTGGLDKANELLGRFYYFEGLPEKGRGLGTKIGVPTVNLKVEDEKILPPGVHTAIIGVNGREWPAVINIGIRPTFFSEGKTVPEINILGFSGKWPAKKTGVYLCSNIRKEKRFANISDLTKQIAMDIAQAKAYFGMLE